MEYFLTGELIGREQRTLPASTYNIMRTLFSQCGESCIFVPVRSIQYQAIIDAKEVNFVYAHRRTHIEFVWKNFEPQQRFSLSDPVNYEFLYYDDRALETMKRAQIEFHNYAQQLLDKRKNTNSDIYSQEQKIAQLHRAVDLDESE